MDYINLTFPMNYGKIMPDNNPIFGVFVRNVPCLESE